MNTLQEQKNRPFKPADDAVYLVDGSGYIFRAYYAIRPLTSPSGVPTNAVYGFTSMLLKLLKEHKPKYIAVAFDTKTKTFRHEAYKDYKANRPAPPDDLIPQFELIHRIVDALDIPILVQPGVEADDLIGTMAHKAKEAGHQVIIVTADKDMMQLIDKDVYMLDELRAIRNGGEQFMNVNEVIQKFGVEPRYVVDVLGLAGDASDNVPGVRGIGEKTATELVKEYGPIESILNAAPTMSQKSRREKLMADSKMALLSKQLVTIKCDINIAATLDDLKAKMPSLAKAGALFNELGFKRFLQDGYFQEAHALANASNEPNTPVTSVVVDHTTYTCITTREQLDALGLLLKQATRIAVDTETNSLDAMQSKLVGISLSWDEGKASYIPVAHTPDVAPIQLALSDVKAVLEPILTDASKIIIAQNAKFDQKVLTRAGFKPFVVASDPMLASYVLRAESARHGLDNLSKEFLGHDVISFEDVCGSGRTKITFDKVPLDKATAYSAEDADTTWRLANILEEKIDKEGLKELYYDLELPVEKVLLKMELAGVKIDTDLLAKMSSEFEDKLKKIEQQATEHAGMPFNLASPKQVADVLFGKLGLGHVKKTKTGLSTDSSVLEELEGEHPIITLILEHRLISKLKGTYIDALPTLIHPETGRVHTTFNQCVTATGRLSSSDPNLQNIPIRSQEGRRIREAFIAEKGCVLVSLDYSQIELRLLAHITNDPVMVDAFLKNEDVHQRTASEIFSVPLRDVTKEQRSAAKTINFGLMYGMGVHRLSQTLHISRAEASNYLKRYYERYAGVFNWQKAALEEAKRTLVVKTLFGRRREVPELKSNNRVLVQRAERIAINTPLQGTAADIIKKAMIHVDKTLQKKHPHARMILQVHDELIIECLKDEAESVCDIARECMTHAAALNVPLVVDSGIAHSWAEAH